MARSARGPLHALLLAAALLAAIPASSSPFGTAYTANVSNLPGSESAMLLFDGLEEAVGSSGLLVNETATTLGSVELLEFSLSTADGNPFLGQQDDALAVASVSVTGLHWFGVPTPAVMVANSAFLYLTIDGVPQALSDVMGLGLSFSTHPLDPGIPIVLIDNEPGTSFVFDSFDTSLAEAFAALVDPATAALIDDLHLGVAAVPIPEPGAGTLLAGGLLGLALSRRRPRGRGGRCGRFSSGWATRRSSPFPSSSRWPFSPEVSCSSATSRASRSPASSPGGSSGPRSPAA